MLDRALARDLKRRAAQMPVATLLGPRQSGKTTLSRTLFPDHRYVSLERPDIREEAKRDPMAFLQRDSNLILDEVQRAPELLSYIQFFVDEDPRPGRFILTGSQNVLLADQVSQTLAGRTALFTLLPFSITELERVDPIDPRELATFESGRHSPKRSLWTQLFVGFYPRIHDQNLQPTEWLADYVRTYVERDLQGILRLTDQSAFERFLQLVAARTACELNLSELAADVGISQPTAKSWLSALEASYLVALVPPHHINYRKRVRKRHKLHVLDSGLCCYLLGIRSAEQLEKHPLRGAIFESYVASEMFKAFFNAALQPSIYHWRTSSGHELDLLLDFGDTLLPLETKSASVLANDAAKGLERWLDIKENHNTSGVLIYGGDHAQDIGRVRAIPWHFVSTRNASVEHDRP